MSMMIPGQMHVEDIPAIPNKVAQRVEQYMQSRSAFFCDWHPQGDGMFISTRFGDTYQLHSLKQPDAARKQLTFYSEPLYSADYCQAGSDHGFLFSMDIINNDRQKVGCHFLHLIVRH